ncbi:MAG: DNA polymerase III subunit delta [Oscillospiraceae bacterium]|nr:DNA polymerase III subunit delta [Oscillospiraceae bacterium]
MNYEPKKLKEALAGGCPVFYFYSTEEYLVQQHAQKALAALEEEDPDMTRIDGPTPAVEEILLAAGTVSFFSTRRVVFLPRLRPTTYSDKDLALLCDALATAENAVFVITTVFEDDKAKKAKRAKQFIDLCGKIGFAAELAQPTPGDMIKEMQRHAKALKTELTADAARAMLERSGQDQFLLSNEVDKLAALSGYTQITKELVEQAGTQNLDADVFEMARLITGGRAELACRKLNTLLQMQNDPVAIAAALMNTYIDMYRVRCGMNSGRAYTAVFKDFAYKGGDWRLRKAAETASRYSMGQLVRCLDLLQELDEKLKSSPVEDEILLQTAVCRLAEMGGRR